MNKEILVGILLFAVYSVGVFSGVYMANEDKEIDDIDLISPKLELCDCYTDEILKILDFVVYIRTTQKTNYPECEEMITEVFEYFPKEIKNCCEETIKEAEVILENH